jgi:hypothetical protein
MALASSTKKRKMEENLRKRLERGAKKMAAKALRKEKKNA